MLFYAVLCFIIVIIVNVFLCNLCCFMLIVFYYCNYCKCFLCNCAVFYAVLFYYCNYYKCIFYVICAVLCCIVFLL